MAASSGAERLFPTSIPEIDFDHVVGLRGVDRRFDPLLRPATGHRPAAACRPVGGVGIGEVETMMGPTAVGRDLGPLDFSERRTLTALGDEVTDTNFDPASGGQLGLPTSFQIVKCAATGVHDPVLSAQISGVAGGAELIADQVPGMVSRAGRDGGLRGAIAVSPDQTGNPQPTARFLNLVRLVGDSHRIGFWKTKLSTDIGQPSRGHGSGRVSGAAVSTRSTRAKLAESNIHSGRGPSRSPERPCPANTSVCWTWGFAASVSQRLGGSSVAAERDCHVWTRRHGRYRRKRGRTRATKHRSVGGV